MKKTKKTVMTGLCSAVLCIVSPFVIPIPISPVPISLAPCVVFVSAFILPPVQCTLSVLVYLMLGAVGLPVFAGFTGGVGVIAGPTGGYIIGYLAAAFTASFFNSIADKKIISFAGMLTGLAVMYITGTIWFCFSQKVSIVSALMVCVIPYLIGDVIKITAALFIGGKIRNSVVLK